LDVQRRFALNRQEAMWGLGFRQTIAGIKDSAAIRLASNTDLGPDLRVFEH
jgi:hypothetical protein